MTVRYEQTVAETGWCIPFGSVITYNDPPPLQVQRWLEAGVVTVVRNPDADLEMPERDELFEEAARSGRPFVPRLCPGGTVVCLGAGPSLTKADVDFCRGKATVIAVNKSYALAPWAEVLYACDAKFWRWEHGAPTFPGLKFALRSADLQFPEAAGIQVLDNTGVTGLESSPTGLRNGKNSGYQAINLAVHLGATRIVLLGYDMRFGRNGKSHWHGEHPDGIKPPIATFIANFQTLVKPLASRGVTIINCTRQTALTCFPQQSLALALNAQESVPA